MKFEEFPLRIPNVKSIEGKIKVLVDELNNATDEKVALKVVKKFFKLTDVIETNTTVISIRNSIDTTDKKYEKAMAKVDEVGPVLSSYSQAFDKALLFKI